MAMPNVQFHVLNGDGARWIRKGIKVEKAFTNLTRSTEARSAVRTASKNEATSLATMLSVGKFEQAMC